MKKIWIVTNFISKVKDCFTIDVSFVVLDFFSLTELRSVSIKMYRIAIVSVLLSVSLLAVSGKKWIYNMLRILQQIIQLSCRYLDSQKEKKLSIKCYGAVLVCKKHRMGKTDCSLTRLGKVEIL